MKPSAIAVAVGYAGLVAGTLSLGAVELALGEDLMLGARSSAVQQHSVNREAKADRLAAPPSAPTGTTLSFRTPGVPDTLVVTRIPGADQAPTTGIKSDNMSLRSTVRPAPVKRTVACEPSVSVLTEVAKLLDASRCVT